MMKLYGYYRSSASYRIRIALNYKGIDWEYVSVRLDKGEQREAKYLAMNPMGLVPLLDTGDARIAESAAIAEHLEFLHPQPAMLPDDPLLRAQVREMQHVIGSGVQPVTNLRILQHLRTEFGLDDEGVDRWCQKWIARGFTAFEKFAESRSANGHFAVGDSLTYADAWLLPQYYNANRFGLDTGPFPLINSIVEHCSTIEAVAAAHPSRQPDAPEA
jgi:maleylacetoacetate isomerase